MRFPWTLRPSRSFACAGMVLAAAIPIGDEVREEPSIDRARSTVTIRVSKAGALSGLAHEHIVSAPIASARLQQGPSPEVEVVFETRSLEVLDPGLSASDRARVREVMEGAQVLDAMRYPQIVFHATDVHRQEGGRYTLTGTLSLHGRDRPLRLDVALHEGRWRGSAILIQSDFGIEPVRFAGGLVRVRDAVEVEVNVALEGS